MAYGEELSNKNQLARPLRLQSREAKALAQAELASHRLSLFPSPPCLTLHEAATCKILGQWNIDCGDLNKDEILLQV